MDNDAFCKLGAADLLAAVAQAAGATPASCVRLPSLPAKLRRGGLKNWLGVDLAARLLPLAIQMAPAPSPENDWEERIRVSGAPIDPGEALLFASVAATRESSLLTGDKRALKAVSGVAGLAEMLRGRLICIEAALLAVCRTEGLDFVRSRVGPAIRLDTALSVCFASRDPTEALGHYVQDLEKQLPANLLLRP